MSYIKSTKSDVGLSNVDNTSDVNKPISTLAQTALDGKIAKGELVFNVKDYGAVGNGTTNDTVAIQAAITAAEVNGGTVFIPAGSYKVVLPQITVGGIVIEGAGWKSELILADATLTPSGMTIGLWVNGASNVIIRNLSINGNFTNIAKNGSYLSASPLWDTTIAKYGATSVKNYAYGEGSGVDYDTYLQYSSCLRITDATNVLVEGCYFHDSKSSGVLMDSATVDGTKEIMIRNNRVKMCWDNGIYFHRGIRFGSAIGNHCSDTVYSGITSIYNKDVLISGNTVHDTGPSPSDSSGIEICSADRNTVSNNNLYNVLFAGILVKNSDETNLINGYAGQFTRSYDTLIQGNNISDVISPSNSHIGHGIHIRSADRTNIVGNQIRRTDYGISIDDAVDSTLVSSNLVDSTTGWGIYVGNNADTTNTVIDGNTVQNGKDNGMTVFSPATITNNIIRNNDHQGIDLVAPPTGVPYKTDIIRDNVISDNGYNGIGAGAGRGNIAIIRDNIFSNSDYRTYEDGISVLSDNTFTSNLATFESQHVGAVVIIPSAGSTNGNDTLVTYITSVNSSHSVELDAAPQITRGNLSFTVYAPKNMHYDGAMISGSPNLTSASAKFTSNDVGKDVVLYSSNTPNASVTGTYTVVTYISPTVVSLNASPMNDINIAFVIKRNYGKQGRAVYISNNSDILFEGNRTYGMSTENINYYSLGKSSAMRQNFDYGSNRVFDDPHDKVIYQLETVNYTRYLGDKDTSSGIDASGGSKDVYLPGLSVVPAGTVFTVFKTDSSANTVTVRGDKLNGVTNGTFVLSNIGESVVVISAGSSLGYFNVSDSKNQTAITGNAGTATALQTARTIAGVSFNGTANIAIASTGLSNSSSITLNTSAQTLTNKRITRRVTTPALASNVYTIAGDTTDTAKISTAPVANFTIANPSGTPSDDQKLELVILSGATGYTPSFGTVFMGSTELPLPTTSLTASKRTRFGFVYDSTLAKWVLIAKTEY